MAFCLGSAPYAGDDDGSKCIQAASSRNGKMLILVALNKFPEVDELAEADWS
ncbi:MAG: hypothetical protein ACU843_09370 [Gammaproteobacteria bacterium]